MDAVTRPLDQKEYSSEKIDLRVWRRLIAYAMRRKGDVARLACVLLVVSLLCCTPLVAKLWDWLRRRTWTRLATVGLLLVVTTAYVVGNTNSPFLYFNF